MLFIILKTTHKFFFHEKKNLLQFLLFTTLFIHIVIVIFLKLFTYKKNKIDII